MPTLTVSADDSATAMEEEIVKSWVRILTFCQQKKQVGKFILKQQMTLNLKLVVRQ